MSRRKSSVPFLTETERADVTTWTRDDILAGITAQNGPQRPDEITADDYKDAAGVGRSTAQQRLGRALRTKKPLDGMLVVGKRQYGRQMFFKVRKWTP